MRQSASWTRCLEREQKAYLPITDILRNSLLESNDVTMSYNDVAFDRILCKDRHREREGGEMESEGQTDRRSQKLFVHRKIKKKSAYLTNN